MHWNNFTRGTRAAIAVVVAAVGLAFVLACSGLGGITEEDITKNLTAEQQAMVVAEPDAVTKALTDAGFAPFAIKGTGGSGSYAIIYFALKNSDATLAKGHGTVNEPWITRNLVDAPKDTKGEDYRKFADSRLTIVGDDRQDNQEHRPQGATAQHFVCNVEPPIAAEALKQLPARMKKHETSAEFDLVIAGTTFTHCLKG
jgi:hypothetical protein